MRWKWLDRLIVKINNMSINLTAWAAKKQMEKWEKQAKKDAIKIKSNEEEYKDIMDESDGKLKKVVYLDDDE